ncbi:hypothetical protein VO63_15110 [Streptomyces showdoensis]|uniref:NACHT domain-containing protein n=2 Tax=Streptomyces showdoensis TaxID=68268 RepID=A0A2P2GNP6_STREW|nr:hypothetical protein VO63_15110 [Streptomyces showdoensis]
MGEEPGERSVTVDNGTGIVVVGDGNRIVAGAAAPVRSAYWEQVGRLAPAELRDREDELAELAAFCRGGAPGYLWWRADAWAGKTALMAWFALRPPPGVRIVPFFVTARWAAQSDAAAYLDVVLEQLAELAAEPLPALLTAATRQAHLLRLYGAAARACAERGERLVLLVDGLDEDRGVTTGPDAHSIAALLPDDLPVVVSGRLNPPLPADVPDTHPLRDPAAVRLLAPSPSARAIRVEAERELKHLLTAGGLPYELLALLTAAGGGLTADDLAELTDEVPYRVRDLLRTGPGRTFAPAGPAYLLAHEELAAQAREMLGPRELDRFRARLHTWAQRWRERGWPEGTPEHLLRGYVAMLRAAGDVDRLVSCALDTARHGRLLAVTGGDGAALAEVRAAEEALLAGGDRPDLVPLMLRLAIRRDGLELSGGLVRPELAAGWAAVGEVDRAVALARGAGDEGAVAGLCAVAATLLRRGDRDRAVRLAEEAETLALRDRESYGRDRASADAAMLLVALGFHERAERQVRRIVSDHNRYRPLYALTRAFCATDKYERALGLARGEPHIRLRANARSETVRSLIWAGRGGDAEQAARETDPNRAVAAVVLIRAATALREAGQDGAVADLLAEGLRQYEVMEPDEDGAGLRRKLIEALVEAGELGLARAPRHPSNGGDAEAYTVALARIGAWDLAWEAFDSASDGVLASFPRVTAERGLDGEAEEMALGLPPGEYAENVWEIIAETRLAREEPDTVMPLLGRLTESARGFAAIGELVRQLTMRGRVDEAREVVARMTGPEHELRLTSALIGPAAESLHDVGYFAEARELLTAAEAGSRKPPRRMLVERLAGCARALAETGQRERASVLLDGVTHEQDRDDGDLVPALLATGQTGLAESFAVRSHDWIGAVARVAAARIAEGSLAEAGPLFTAARSGVRVSEATAYARSGEVERAAWLARRLTADLDVIEVSTALAHALALQGRREEAEQWLDRAVEVSWPRAATTAYMLPDLVRAQLALGRREEATALLHRATRSWLTYYGSSQPEYLLRAWVLLGAHDHALDLVRRLEPDAVQKALPLLAADLARAGEHARAEAVLAELHHLGPKCAAAYTVLAVEHPDPRRARELTALALHLGPWYEALPAVLAREPGAREEVVAEGERLRLLLR